MNHLEKNKNVNSWLVEVAGDGAHDSFIVEGSLIDLKLAFCRDDVDAEIYTPDLEYEYNWDMYGVFYLDLEQAYIRATPIRRGLK